jgi:hypothetical protein
MSVNARANVPLVIYEGATFKQTFQWKTGNPAVAVNLTGYTGIMQVRADIADETPLFDLDVSNGGIIIETPETDGKYSISIDAEDTAGICPDHELIVGVYDLFLILGDVYMLQQYGQVLIHPSVTRE